LPLTLEHRQHDIFELFARRQAREVFSRDVAARDLVVPRSDVEERTTRIGVDFDESRAVRADVQVKTQEHARV
jgi:hypothetical protein